jgi:hypothetical protein
VPFAPQFRRPLDQKLPAKTLDTARHINLIILPAASVRSAGLEKHAGEVLGRWLGVSASAALRYEGPLIETSESAF